MVANGQASLRKPSGFENHNRNVTEDTNWFRMLVRVNPHEAWCELLPHADLHMDSLSQPSFNPLTRSTLPLYSSQLCGFGGKIPFSVGLLAVGLLPIGSGRVVCVTSTTLLQRNVIIGPILGVWVENTELPRRQYSF